jgi:hypothetical protein
VKKASKAEAEYTGRSDNPKTICRNCAHFQSRTDPTLHGTCQRVEGVIDSLGWCKFWESRYYGTKRVKGFRT